MRKLLKNGSDRLSLLKGKCDLTGRLLSTNPDSPGLVPSTGTGLLAYEVSNRACSRAIFTLPNLMIPFCRLFGLVFFFGARVVLFVAVVSVQAVTPVTTGDLVRCRLLTPGQEVNSSRSIPKREIERDSVCVFLSLILLSDIYRCRESISDRTKNKFEFLLAISIMANKNFSVQF